MYTLEPKAEDWEYWHVYQNTRFSWNCAMGFASVWQRFAGFVVKVKYGGMGESRRLLVTY
jgi:hypothetical protein